MDIRTVLRVLPKLKMASSRLRAALSRLRAEIIWYLMYEPSWFPEFGFALAAMGWGLFAFTTDDFTLTKWDYGLPAVAILIGFTRGMALAWQWYTGRVILSFFSTLLWGKLLISLITKYGTIPMMGPLIGCLVIDLLTVAKFSVWPMWEQEQERKALHGGE